MTKNKKRNIFILVACAAVLAAGLYFVLVYYQNQSSRSREVIANMLNEVNKETGNKGKASIIANYLAGHNDLFEMKNPFVRFSFSFSKAQERSLMDYEECRLNGEKMKVFCMLSHQMYNYIDLYGSEGEVDVERLLRIAEYSADVCLESGSNFINNGCTRFMDEDPVPPMDYQ